MFVAFTTKIVQIIVIIIISRIHLWDLGAGDIYPAHTVQFGDKVCRHHHNYFIIIIVMIFIIVNIATIFIIIIISL